MPTLPHPRTAPEKSLFLFKEPMDAEEREQNLLGCVFKDKHRGTLGEYTPQGPLDAESNASAARSEDAGAVQTPPTGILVS